MSSGRYHVPSVLHVYPGGVDPAGRTAGATTAVSICAGSSSTTAAVAITALVAHAATLVAPKDASSHGRTPPRLYLVQSAADCLHQWSEPLLRFITVFFAHMYGQWLGHFSRPPWAWQSYQPKFVVMGCSLPSWHVMDSLSLAKHLAWLVVFPAGHAVHVSWFVVLEYVSVPQSTHVFPDTCVPLGHGASPVSAPVSASASRSPPPSAFGEGPPKRVQASDVPVFFFFVVFALFFPAFFTSSALDSVRASLDAPVSSSRSVLEIFLRRTFAARCVTPSSATTTAFDSSLSATKALPSTLCSRSWSMICWLSWVSAAHRETPCCSHSFMGVRRCARPSPPSLGAIHQFVIDQTRKRKNRQQQVEPAAFAMWGGGARVRGVFLKRRGAIAPRDAIDFPEMVKFDLLNHHP